MSADRTLIGGWNGLQQAQDGTGKGSGTARRDDRRQRELGCDVAQAQKLVAIWNSRAVRKARPSFYPTIETALLAGRRGWPTNAQPVSSSGTLTFCL